MILIIDIAKGIMQEVIKGMEGSIIITITTTIEEVATEIKITIGTGLGHMKDRTETEDTVEA